MSAAAEVLATRLDAISRQLRLQADDLAAVRGLADSAHRVLGDLTDRVDVVEKLATMPAPPAGSGGGSWLADPDPQALGDLAGWVDRVLVHYPSTVEVLGDCWPWHPWVVEELLALSRAWSEAYDVERPSGIRAVDWHDRYRPGVMDRIRRTLSDCGLEAHGPGRRADHTRLPAVCGADQVPAAADWWTAARPPSTP